MLTLHCLDTKEAILMIEMVGHLLPQSTVNTFVKRK